MKCKDQYDLRVPQWIQNLIFITSTSSTNQNTDSPKKDCRIIHSFSRWQNTRNSQQCDCNMIRFSTASIHNPSGFEHSKYILPIQDSMMGILYRCSSCGYRYSQSRYKYRGSISPRMKRVTVYFHPNPRKILISNMVLNAKPRSRKYTGILLQHRVPQIPSTSNVDTMSVICICRGCLLICGFFQ